MLTSRLRHIVLTALVLAGCSRSPAPGPRATQATFDSLLAQHAQHIIRGEIEPILALYTPDVVVRSNHAEPLGGRDALGTFISQMLGAMPFQALEYRTDEISIQRDSAWQIGTYQLTAAPPRQPPLHERGSFFALWVRDASGTWRIHRDILNSSVPLIPPSVR